jgi:hypothetical protein
MIERKKGFAKDWRRKKKYEIKENEKKCADKVEALKEKRH